MRPAPNSTNAVSSRSSNRQPPELAGFHWVGWVRSPHGLKGEVYIQLKTKVADWLDSVEAFTLWNDGKTQLLEIDRITPFKDGLRVKFLTIDDRNQSEALHKWQVYIEDDLLVSEPGESVYLKQILDFEIVDPSGLHIGTIVGFATNGVQDLLRVMVPIEGQESSKNSPRSGHEALVPFVDAFIVRLDLEKKQVVMDLPPGLLAADLK